MTATTSQVPALIDALITQCPNVMPDGVIVQDGLGTDGTPGDYLYVGVGAEFGTGSSVRSADTQQVKATLGSGRSRDETGTVVCAAYSWNGGGDQKTVRDAAYAIVAAVETLLRTSPNLGIAAGGMFDAELGSQWLDQSSDANGVDALIVFEIKFRARI